MVLQKFLLLFFLSYEVFASGILLVGDSMAEAVAKPLESKFKSTSDSYKYIFKRGTQVHYWIDNPTLYLDLFRSKPDILLISLGTNDLVAKRSNEKIIENLHILIDEMISFGVKKKNIFLIAPPIQNDNDLNEAMEKSFGSHLIKSKDLLLELKEDHIHPTPESNRIWSGYIFDFLSHFEDGGNYR